ncbi:MAG: carbon storage regulator CsrA [Firmicutes bacterium]|nr:carbon storage regulator CsrA [Bacillota bacterium]
MLVLTRKVDQSIMIGDHIRVVIVDIRGDQVKVGIEAPKDISVHRQEVYQEIQEENRRAVLSKAFNVQDLTKVLKQSPEDQS